MSLRKAADAKNVNYGTLNRYLKKKKACAEQEAINMCLTPNYACRKVFTNAAEMTLKEYLIKCSKMCYGLDTIETRKLAYEMTVFQNLEMPQNWKDKKMAGVDWLYGF